MTLLSQLLRWHDLSAVEKLAAVVVGIDNGLIVVPDGGALHVALVRILIDSTRAQNPQEVVDRRALAAAEAWADCPCKKHRQAVAEAWVAAWTLVAGTAKHSAAEGAAWAARITARVAARTAMRAPVACFVHRLPPPVVTINGVEYDLGDETTRAVIALAEAA